MVKGRYLCAAAVGLSTLACISVSHDPAGRFEIVRYTVTPASGPPQVVEDAGSLQLGDVLTCDSGFARDDGGGAADCGVDQGVAAVSIVSYAWVGGGLTPLLDPEIVQFARPGWSTDTDGWTGPIPLANLSCMLVRESRHPLVLTGDCDGPDGGPFTVELVMDR